MRILIIEPQKVARDALRNLVREALRDATVVHADTLQEWMHHRAGDRPDLIILGDGRLELIELAAVAAPGATIVALGLHDDALYRKQALLSGAHAYIPREHAADQLPRLLATLQLEAA